MNKKDIRIEVKLSTFDEIDTVSPVLIENADGIQYFGVKEMKDSIKKTYYHLFKDNDTFAKRVQFLESIEAKGQKFFNPAYNNFRILLIKD